MNDAANIVYCRVSECKYHAKNDTCSAGEILINSMTSSAMSSENTLCQTFRRGIQ